MLSTSPAAATRCAALAFGALLIFLLVAAPAAQAQTFTTLYTFTGLADGGTPYAGVILDAQNNAYGTTLYGGTHGFGTVFKVTPSGAETVLLSFPDQWHGKYPEGRLFRDSHGNLFGTTFNGGSESCHPGCGTAFKLTSAGVERMLHDFTGGSDGANPQAGLIEDSQGNLYGTTVNGGSSDQGTIFKITPLRVKTVIHTFSGGADGRNPVAGLIQDSQGNFYGTTVNGGTAPWPCNIGCGTVFKVSPTGVETVLHSFQSTPDGAYPPTTTLVLDAQGNLYGTTGYGGAFGWGTVFKLAPDGTETVLYSFTGGADGRGPQSLVRDTNGNLYGTTGGGGAGTACGAQGCGTIFKLTGSGTETVLHSFTGGADGSEPIGLAIDAQGNLYGTTMLNGAHNAGTVFKLTP